MAGPVNERQVVREAAAQNGIRPSTLWGVYGTETSFGKDLSTSGAGAEGPFQIMPGTARSLGVKDVHNFTEAAHGAARYLAQFKGRGLAGMLSAYNAGPAGGMQSDYVKKVEANARSWGSETGSAGVGGAAPGTGGSQGAPGQLVASRSESGPSGVTQEALGQVLAAVKALSGPGIVAAGASPAKPAFSAAPPLPEGARSPMPLQPAKTPASQLQALVEQAITAAGSSNVESKVQSVPGASSGAIGTGPSAASGAAGIKGFLPAGASYQVMRTDKGKDFQLKPGTPLLATGDFKVIAVPSDPGGFGPAYPVVEFTSGPDKGHQLYFGHTDSAVKVGQTGHANEVLAHTSRTGHNAPPGWLELGLWGPGGPQGQGSGETAAGKLVAQLLGVH